MPTRRTKFNSDINKEKSPELKEGKRGKILLNISLFTGQVEWIVSRGISSFLFPQMESLI